MTGSMHLPLSGFRSISGMLADAADNSSPQMVGMRGSVDHPGRKDMQILGNPIRVDGQRLPNRAAALLGADSDAILAGIGYDAAAISDLHQYGVV
jgi:crotonobetainyl-CoA:carnitine CoA-transferase CaiB-like acyl-CoA transferase